MDNQEWIKSLARVSYYADNWKEQYRNDYAKEPEVIGEARYEVIIAHGIVNRSSFRLHGKGMKTEDYRALGVDAIILLDQRKNVPIKMQGKPGSFQSIDAICVKNHPARKTEETAERSYTQNSGAD